VDQVMGRSQDEKGADKAVAIRRGQQKERARLQTEIQAEQKIISQVSEERSPIAAEVRKVEAEVGPIKYIAKFIYGDKGADENMLEKAVTWIIVLIVVVFDPLAVIMLLAAQMTFGWRKQPSINDFVPQPTEFINKEEINDSQYEPDDGPLTNEQLDKIQELADQQIAEEQTKNTTLTRELEAVKATAENLKKKFMNSFSNLLKK
jgi:hypothetical protein